MIVRSPACSFVLASAIVGSAILAAQGSDATILILETSRVGTMQRELQQAADRGYRLVPLSRGWCVTETTALVERRSADVEPVEYLVLSAGTTMMQQELDEASGKGYHFAGFLAGRTSVTQGARPTIVMQRSRGVTARTREYLLVGTSLARTLEGELRQAVDEGFRVVAAVNAVNDEYLVLLDKQPKGADTPAPDYLLEVTVLSSTLERALQTAADAGYRLVKLQGVSGGLLEKTPADVEPIEYKVISTIRTETMQKELDAAAAAGYRFATSVDRMVLALQRAKGSQHRTHEYVVLKTSRLATMEREILAQVAKGFRVVHADCNPVSPWRDEHATILERRVK